MTIPFLDVGAAYRELKPEIDAAVARVLDSGWYILGPEVEAFEAEWAACCEAADRYRNYGDFHAAFGKQLPLRTT